MNIRLCIALSASVFLPSVAMNQSGEGLTRSKASSNLPSISLNSFPYVNKAQVLAMLKGMESYTIDKQFLQNTISTIRVKDSYGPNMLRYVAHYLEIAQYDYEKYLRDTEQEADEAIVRGFKRARDTIAYRLAQCPRPAVLESPRGLVAAYPMMFPIDDIHDVEPVSTKHVRGKENLAHKLESPRNDVQFTIEL